MIIARSPLRITLGGGGTDLPSYSNQHGGFVLAAAIDKYVYVTAMRPFTPGIFLKYSQLEHVATVSEIQHPIIRAVLREFDLRTPQIEITTQTDIPAGTGLGSSSSFTTALIKALYTHRRWSMPPAELAAFACEIEIDHLVQPIGKQDQYIAAHGGLNTLIFHSNGVVTVKPLRLTPQTLFALEDNLLLFFTGFSRNATDILANQHMRTLHGDEDVLVNLHAVKGLAYQTQYALEAEDLPLFADLLSAQWTQKKQRFPGMTNPQIDAWYELGRANGAMGGKLVGAGGGGFLLFYTEEHRRLRTAMTTAGLEEVRFRFDFDGTTVRS